MTIKIKYFFPFYALKRITKFIHASIGTLAIKK